MFTSKNRICSKHFELYFVPRSQFAWKGKIPTRSYRFHGVHSLDHIIKFRDALEIAYSWYVKKGWKLGSEKIKVYFQHLPNSEGRTYVRPLKIMFPPRHEDKEGPSNMLRLKAAVAHELFHIAQAQLRPQSFYNFDPWAWFSEATASFMESEVFQDNRQYLAYLYKWLEEPDRPLAVGPDGSREYGSLLFCKFLQAKSGDDDIIRKVWKLAPTCDTPFEAVEKCMKKYPIASARKKDLFVDHFSVWNFFLNGLVPGYEEGTLYAELFQHAYAEPLLRGIRGKTQSVEFGPLPSLAVRYHLIKIPSHARKVKISISVNADRSAAVPGKGILRLISDKKELLVEPHPIFLKKMAKGEPFVGNINTSINNKGKSSARFALLIFANTSWGIKSTLIHKYQVDLLVA